MKIPLFSLVLTAGASLTLSAQQFPPSATVRIDGNIPDGTPPPPEAPKPKFLVRSRDILKAETHLQGGRKITVNTIKPITLPSPPVIPAAAKIDDPAILKKLADARRLRRPRLDMLRLGASIFRFQNSPPRSLVRYWPGDSANPIVFWSSEDFSLLEGLASYIDPSGEPRSYSLSFGDAQLDRNGKPKLTFEAGANHIPDFPPGKASFQILSGQPDAEAIAVIQQLHNLIDQNHDRLQAAANSRKQARLLEESELKAHRRNQKTSSSAPGASPPRLQPLRRKEPSPDETAALPHLPADRQPGLRAHRFQSKWHQRPCGAPSEPRPAPRCRHRCPRQARRRMEPQ